jgi:hypothetical protein
MPSLPRRIQPGAARRSGATWSDGLAVDGCRLQALPMHLNLDEEGRPRQRPAVGILCTHLDTLLVQCQAKSSVLSAAHANALAHLLSAPLLESPSRRRERGPCSGTVLVPCCRAIPSCRHDVTAGLLFQTSGGDSQLQKYSFQLTLFVLQSSCN